MFLPARDTVSGYCGERRNRKLNCYYLRKVVFKLKIKRLLAVCLAAVLMVSAMAIPASASDDPDSGIMPAAVWSAARKSNYDMWPTYGKISYRPGPFDDCWGATCYYIDDHSKAYGASCSGKSYCKIWGEDGTSKQSYTTTKNSANDLYTQTDKVSGQWYAKELLHCYVNYTANNWRQDITVYTE